MNLRTAGSFSKRSRLYFINTMYTTHRI